MFKIGNFYYPDSGGSFWTDLFISLFSTAIGVLFAWFIFRRTIKHEKQTDDLRKEEYLIGRMRYLLILLKEVISTTEKQAENFVLQAENILANPYEYHLVKILASNQLERLTKIDNQDVFEAYTFLFDNNQTTVKEYVKLLNYFDFLEKRLSQAHTSNESNTKTVGNRQDQMKIYVDQLYSDFPKFCNADPAMKIIWEKHFPIFDSHIGSGRVNVEKLHTQFLIPLFENVKSLNAEDKENQRLFIASIRSATTTVEHYRNNNFNYGVDEALNVKRDLQDVLTSLKVYSKNIKEKLIAIK